MKDHETEEPRTGASPVRFAVVGLGWIAQAAVLPAFAHAKDTELVALITDDAEKLRDLKRRYRVKHTAAYSGFEECLRESRAEAVYIALPNSMHKEYAIRAAACGVHVLCEKPMAPTPADCRAMIDAGATNGVKLMVAYRLHFEQATLDAIDAIDRWQLGDLRSFASTFTNPVHAGNVRLVDDLGGGPLADLGIYCINAARYLFRAEPDEVFAWTATKDPEGRFREVPEMYSVMMRFPGERLATFICGFGAAPCSALEITGTKGTLRLEPAYEFETGLKSFLTVNAKTERRDYPKRDQFAAELEYFALCIRRDLEPEPSGVEGLLDAQIIEGLEISAANRAPVTLALTPRDRRPDRTLAINLPPAREPRLVHAAPPEAARQFGHRSPL